MEEGVREAMEVEGLERRSYPDGDRWWPALVWRWDRPLPCISSAPLGGGLGRCSWVVNAQVPRSYGRLDPDQHLAELADWFGLAGPGVGMLTAADVATVRVAQRTGVTAAATVGLAVPTWAAADDDGVVTRPPTEQAGTINVVAHLACRLSPAAMVNAVATATEAKSQALWEAGVAATGTATDAVCIVGHDTGPAAVFAGPRSEWGAALARAVHRAVAEGAHAWATTWE